MPQQVLNLSMSVVDGYEEPLAIPSEVKESGEEGTRT